MQDELKDTPTQNPIEPEITTPVLEHVVIKRSKKKIYILCALVVLLIALLAGLLLHSKHTVNQSNVNTAKVAAKSKLTVPASTKTAVASSNVQGLQLDPNKNYGNKYSNGILPVGDGKYSTTTPKQGYVYACSQYAQSLSSGQGGAGSRGPWFTDNNTEYDINKKLHVEGDVMWSASFSDTVSGDTRTIVTNDLPDHPTGIFPIMSSDPAYSYDHNPNSIKGQSFTYSLNANPTYGSPNCMGGESGIMLTGIALFNAFDAGGRDAGAWEVQDSCEGHPQMDGIYHYHTLSNCIKDISVHNVIGYALDGFPITGPEVGTNNYMTTSDLDVCHGITSQILLNGKEVTMYHYVMTLDFPYSVSCFRGTAIQPPDLKNQSTGSSSTGIGGGSNGRPQQGPPPRP